MRHRPLLVLPLLLLLAAALAPRPAHAQDDFLRPPLAASDVPAARVQWYGMYMTGKKVGYMRDELTRTGSGADAAIVSDTTGKIEIVGMGKKVTIDLSFRHEFDAAPPFALRRARSSVRQTGGGRDVDITRGADGAFSAKVTAAGATRDLPVPKLDYTLADHTASERWVAAGRKEGDTAKVRSIEFDELKLDATTLTILARKESVVAGVPTCWYEVRTVTEKGTEAAMRVDAAGSMISTQIGGVFEARAESEESAKKVEASSDLFVFGMAKLDRPIGPAKKVRRLVLRASGAGAASIPAGPHQEVEPGADGTVTIRIGPAVGEDQAATEDEIRAALAETVNCPTKLPAVTQLAAQAVGDAKTPREKVERLVKFTGDFVVDALTPTAVAVADIIATKKGDCSEHSLLFTALARAAGVPAREVSGLMYMGDDAKAFGGHAWNEVVIDGRWVAVDPTWYETEVDAAHVTLQRNEKGMGLLGTMGRLEFQLVEVETAK